MIGQIHIDSILRGIKEDRFKLEDLPKEIQKEINDNSSKRDYNRSTNY